MSGLTLRLRDPFSSSEQHASSSELRFIAPRIDLFGIVPDRLLGLDVPSIAALPLLIDGRASVVGEQFEIIDEGRGELVLTGDCARCDRVGGGMLEGRMVVRSSVGSHLADSMRGGSLIVDGNAGDYAGSNLRGGTVQIDGNVTDYCAGATPGNRRGMRGGTLVICGHAGRYLGYRMRRGTVVVSRTHIGLAAYMIAGTILVTDTTESNIGDGMRRGSIILLQESPPLVSKGFTVWEPIRLSYLHLVKAQLRPLVQERDWFHRLDFPYRRSLGDRASGGMGEVLWFSRSLPTVDIES